MAKVKDLALKYFAMLLINIFLTFAAFSASNVFHNEGDIPIRTISQTIDTNIPDSTLIVVIDPGHGGKDKGAKFENIFEKDISLKLAIETKQYIESKYPGIIVLLTRDEDIFIPLKDRINLANRVKADIFISIHCNSYYEDISINGSEIYMIGESNKTDKWQIANMENASILLENRHENEYEWYDPNSTEAYIFMSAFENLYSIQSLQLAKIFSDEGKLNETLNFRGIKQSELLVLKNATMPSILLEAGFISNLSDRRFLISAAGKKETAKWLGNSLYKYLSNQHSAVVNN